jgi:hypothetical protein
MRLYMLPLLMATAGLVFGQQAFAQPSQDPEGPPDEPGRPVARISVLSGDASVRRGDSGEWVAAALNAPLLGGDTLSVSPGSAAEIQLSASSFARLAGDSEVRIADFENGRIQLQLSKGLVTYRVLRQTNEDAEVDTPLASVRPLGLAVMRVETAPDGSTHVLVRHGEVEVSTRRGTERVREGSMMVVRGSADDSEFQVVSAPAPDRWDAWSDQRDAYLLHAQSPRYVSQDIYGTEDLDNYGRWSHDPAYGDVWAPTVAAGWAPYRDGRWVWEDYYGWTWVDASPWGWAPFHYGSWYQRPGIGWCWFPGQRSERFWYRPALVGFFGFGGGGGFRSGFGFGNIGWIPLAPYERYHPWYGRGWGGGRNVNFNQVNIVNNTNITNIYRNSRYSNSVTAVSGADFQRGNFRNRVPVDNQHLQQASLVRGMVPMSPGNDHQRFSDRPGASGPRNDPSGQRFFGRQPSAGNTQPGVPFNQQQTRGAQFGNGAPARQNPSPGWQRFGSPQSGERFQGGAPATRSEAPSGAQPATGQRFNGSRFDSTPRNTPGNPGRSLEVAPPIVRERPVQPDYSRGFSGRQAPANSQPSYSPPVYRQAPAQRAPQGNGGGFGAPSYRTPPAQQSAPRSAPAPSFRGNGGAGGGGGGGANNNGGGSRSESRSNSIGHGGRR